VEKTEVITAYGHSLVQATHRTTFEITRDTRLTKKGDCIIAVKADKSPLDLSRDFKKAAKKSDAKITITIEAEGEREIVTASGDSGLLFAHPTDIVVRKSSYVCSRTLAVKADKAANDLSRRLVEKLRNPNQKITITLTVSVPEQDEDPFN
jgi:hypothetical protein